MENNNTVAHIISNLVDVSEITNKWLMWCEGNSPDKSVFVPSIFQMRDAFAHILKIFGNGLQNELFTKETNDFNPIFQEEYSKKQLEEAFTHCARAFYDCADYILLIIKQEINEDIQSSRFLGLRNKILENDAYISKLRSSKSENMEKSYKNIQDWDLFLQGITSLYIFEDIDIKLINIISETNTRVRSIEEKFSETVIKNHDPKFYEKKLEFLNIDKLPDEIEKYFDENVLFEELLENSQAWTSNIINEFNTKIKEAEKYNAHLIGLQKVMVYSNKLNKRRSLFKSAWGIISAIFSFIITNIIKTYLFVSNQGNNNAEQVASNMKALDWKFIMIFTGTFVILFFIGKFILWLFDKKK